MSACTECGGRGLIRHPNGASTQCTCMRRDDLRQMRKDSGIPPRYRDSLLELMNPDLIRAMPMAWSKVVIGHETLDHYAGFALSGRSSLGKSSAVGLYFCAIMSQLMADIHAMSHQTAIQLRTNAPVWISWEEQFEWFQTSAFDPTLNTVVNRLSNCMLLVIDDLGSERDKSESFGQGLLSKIVNHRYDNKLPNIITTQLNREELESRYGTKLISRMLDKSEFVEI